MSFLTLNNMGFALIFQLKEFSHSTSENKCPPASAPHGSELRTPYSGYERSATPSKQTKAFPRVNKESRNPEFLQSISKASKIVIKIIDEGFA